MAHPSCYEQPRAGGPYYPESPDEGGKFEVPATRQVWVGYPTHPKRPAHPNATPSDEPAARRLARRTGQFYDAHVVPSLGPES